MNEWLNIKNLLVKSEIYNYDYCLMVHRGLQFLKIVNYNVYKKDKWQTILLRHRGMFYIKFTRAI